MWIADGKRLICLEGRDIKLECKDIVFEGRISKYCGIPHHRPPAQFFKLLSNA